MTPDEPLMQIRAELRGAVDPEYRRGVLNYFKEQIDPYGVRAPQVKKIAAAAWREWKHWPAGWHAVLG